MKRLELAVLACWAGLSGAVVAQELGPPPRLYPSPEKPAEQPVRIERMTAGYQLVLTREAAELLSETLDKIENEEGIAAALRAAVKDAKDPTVTAQAEVLAWVIRKQVPEFKKALREKRGENGVTIRVFGVERKRLKDRPVLRKLGQAFMPPEIQEKVRNVMAVANTVPLYWSVEPR